MLKHATRLLVVPALAVLLWPFGISHAHAYQALFVPHVVNRSGYVMTRAQIPGPNGGPILVKVLSVGQGGADGEATLTEIDEIGEVHPGNAELNGYYILPGAVYRDYQMAWRRLQSEQMEIAASAEYLDADVVRLQGLRLADGSVWRADIDSAIKTLIVKRQSDRVGRNAANWLLMQVPFRLRRDTPPLEENVISVLLTSAGDILGGPQSTRGKAFSRTDSTVSGRSAYEIENFTFRVGYYGQEGEYEQSRLDLMDLLGFAAQGGSGNLKIFGPVAGAEIDVLDESTVSDPNGRYSINKLWPCVRIGSPVGGYWLDPAELMRVWLTLQTRSYNPAGSGNLPFMMYQDSTLVCGDVMDYQVNHFYVDAIWLTGKVRMSSGPTPESVGSAPVEIGDEIVYGGTPPSADASVQRHFDFDADGVPDRAFLANKVTESVEVAGEMRSYVVPQVPENPGAAKWQAVYFSSSDGARGPDAASPDLRVPDLWRLADPAMNASPSGLLTKISKAALANTDIYVFREGTGELMLEMKGMKRSRNGASIDDVIDRRDNSFFWQALLRGKMQLNFGPTICQGGRCRLTASSGFTDDANDEAFRRTNELMGFQSRYQDRENSTPAPGEELRVIAINRTTGYMGSRRFKLGMPGDHTGDEERYPEGLYGDLSQVIPTITLHPPRLKVWARRIAPPRIGGDPDSNQEKVYLIGHEGAATRKDKVVAVYTRWMDWDERADGGLGREIPLPDGLGLGGGRDFGLTGRLARLTGGELVAVNAGTAVGSAAITDGNLQAGGQVAEFPIAPGEHMQLVRLPDDLRSNEHYYINVFGKPLAREGACDPCEFDRTGTQPPALRGRPNHYTPFWVPRYDETATRRAELERNRLLQQDPDADIAQISPVYDWAIRPEYQFSLIDLEVQAMNAVVKDANGQETTRDLLAAQDAEGALDGAALVRLMYRLILNNEALLPGFDNPNDAEANSGTRQYVFALGEEEVLLSVDARGQVEVDNLAHLFKLGVEDFLTARIYLNHDPENLLWQFAYGTVQLAVDRNRNGCVEFTERTRDEAAYAHCARIERMVGEGDESAPVHDATTPRQPFRFWVNDDYDVVRENGSPLLSATECVPSDGSPQPRARSTDFAESDESANESLEQICEQSDEETSNGESNTATSRLRAIESVRDLEDFFPLAVRLPIDMPANYVVRWSAKGVSLNIFRGSWDDRFGRSAYEYLRNTAAARSQVSLSRRQDGYVGKVSEDSAIQMSAEELAAMQSDSGQIRLLAEGIAGDSPGCEDENDGCYVKVELFAQVDGLLVSLAESRVYFDLRSVDDFMDYWSSGTSEAAAGATSLHPAEPAPVAGVRERTHDILAGVASDALLASDYTLFVHGWRMLEQEKLDFARTAYKRLYWSGYQGRFGLYTWPTGWFDKPDFVYDVGTLARLGYGNLANYNDSEEVARKAGVRLANFLPQLKEEPGQRLHVMAHSMGNVVVSEALRNTPETLVVDSYIASQAAEGAGAYDPLAQEVRHKVWMIGPVSLFESSWDIYHFEGEVPANYRYPPDLFRDVAIGESGVRHPPTRQANYPQADTGRWGTAAQRHYYRGIGQTPAPQNAAQPGNRVARMVNAHNRGDAALRAWELNQLTKPGFDIPDAMNGATVDNWDYSNAVYEACDTPGFFGPEGGGAMLPHWISLVISPPIPAPQCGAETQAADLGGGVFSQYLADGSPRSWAPRARGASEAARQNAGILAHIIPARTHALGQIGGTKGEFGEAPVAISLRGYDNSNQGHSGQFYSSLAERKDYWEKSLEVGAFPSFNMRPVSCLAGWVDAAAGECGRP